MTESFDPLAAVRVTDPEAHRKLDRIIEWIQGDQMQGIPGMAAEHRKHEERLSGHDEKLKSHEDRLERHSQRIHALEDQPAQASAWALRTIAEKLLTIAAAGLAGWLAGKPH